jgi:hypothetical protein
LTGFSKTLFIWSINSAEEINVGRVFALIFILMWPSIAISSPDEADSCRWWEKLLEKADFSKPPDPPPFRPPGVNEFHVSELPEAIRDIPAKLIRRSKLSRHPEIEYGAAALEMDDGTFVVGNFTSNLKNEILIDDINRALFGLYIKTNGQGRIRRLWIFHTHPNVEDSIRWHSTDDYFAAMNIQVPFIRPVPLEMTVVPMEAEQNGILYNKSYPR